MNALKACLLFALVCLSSQFVTAGGLGDKLGNLFNRDAGSDEILHPEIAFQFFPEAAENGELIVSWQIEPGYYLYRDKLAFSSSHPDVSFGNVVLPPGKAKDDPVFGEVQVYYNDNGVSVPLLAGAELPAVLDMVIAFQGCKEDSVCYPPTEKPYAVPLKATTTALLPTQQPLQVSEQDAITRALKDKGLLLNLLSFFGFGFLLALTPCVFPMIPILSGIIVGQGDRITRKRAFMLSLIYVLAMAITYALLGVLAGLFSINLQAAAQNPWVLGLFSLVFVVLALSMFGFYQLQLPASWQAKLMSADVSRNGTLKGAAFMGVLSAVIVGPCVAPPLAGALLYISHTGDALLGGLALFSMGLGFGVPLLVVGATSGELLPRAGAWMETIKRSFGVIMLGVAIWFLERIIPDGPALLLWAILFVSTAVFMGALDRLQGGVSSWQRLNKALGLVLLTYGLVLVVAAANGKGTVLKPFKSFSFGAPVAEQALPFELVSGVEGLNQALQQAVANQQIVMLDFYADWCIACIELEEYTFPDPAVHDALKSVKLLQTDVTANSEQDKALLEAYELFGPPAILFFDRDGKEIRSHRLVGFIKADDFRAHVEQVKSL
ncbi:MAG: protein-disulfide reductase DsbD [Gammaproteobacteria bacterium]